MQSKLLLSFALALGECVLFGSLAKPGDPDPRFDAGGYPLGGIYSGGVIQRDGSLILAGPSPVQSFRGARLIRVFPDGRLDRPFGLDDPLILEGAVTAMAGAPEDRLYLAGRFRGQPAGVGLIAVNRHGVMDTNFQADRLFQTSLRSLAVQSDGRVLLGRSLNAFQTSAPQPLLVRLLTDGSPDPNFEIVLQSTTNRATTVEAILPLPDGQTLVGGRFQVPGQTNFAKLVRLLANGTLDTAYSEPPSVADDHLVSHLAAAQEGVVAVALAPGLSSSRVLRLRENGDVDPLYQDWAGRAPLFPITAILPVDGGVLAGGAGGVARIRWLQPTNSPRWLSLQGSVATLSALSDGSVVAVGSFSEAGGLPRPGFVKLSADGTPDPNYGRIGFSTERLFVQPDFDRSFLIPLPDGGLLVANRSSFYFNGLPQQGLVRLLPDGALDLEFKSDLGPTRTILGVWLTPDDRILVWRQTQSGEQSLVRLLLDGTADPTFVSGLPSTASIRDLRFTSDGTIYVGGSRLFPDDGSGTRVRRLNAAGWLDPGYVLPVNSQLMALHPDGRALVSLAGDLRRFLPDGAPDDSFARPHGSIDRVEVAPDGSVIASGAFIYVGGGPTRGLARWFPDGQRDADFARVSWSGPKIHLAAAPLDRFIAGSPNQVTRRLMSGGIDPSFALSTNVAELRYLASRGEFLFGVETARVGSGQTPNHRIVRYHNHAHTLSLPQLTGEETSLELIAPAGEVHLLEGSHDLIRWDALTTNTVPATNRIVWKLPFDRASNAAGAYFRERRLE